MSNQFKNTIALEGMMRYKSTSVRRKRTDKRNAIKTMQCTRVTDVIKDKKEFRVSGTQEPECPV